MEERVKRIIFSDEVRSIIWVYSIRKDSLHIPNNFGFKRPWKSSNLETFLKIEKMFVASSLAYFVNSWANSAILAIFNLSSANAFNLDQKNLFVVW